MQNKDYFTEGTLKVILLSVTISVHMFSPLGITKSSSRGELLVKGRPLVVVLAKGAQQPLDHRLVVAKGAVVDWNPNVLLVPLQRVLHVVFLNFCVRQGP